MNQWHAPLWFQAFLVVIWSIGLGFDIARHGTARKPRDYNAWVSAAALAVVIYITYCAGIWGYP